MKITLRVKEPNVLTIETCAKHIVFTTLYSMIVTRRSGHNSYGGRGHGGVNGTSDFANKRRVNGTSDFVNKRDGAGGGSLPGK